MAFSFEGGSAGPRSAVEAEQLGGRFVVGFGRLQKRICCSNWREAAIMPTMHSTGFTLSLPAHR